MIALCASLCRSSLMGSVLGPGSRRTRLVVMVWWDRGLRYRILREKTENG